MELVQNVASAIPRIRMYADAQDDHDDHDRNLNIAISHCADVLGSTYEALNWSLSAIHHDPKGLYCKGFKFLTISSFSFIEDKKNQC